MFSRIARLMKGFLSLFVSGLEAANPEALIEAARQEFRQKIAQYNLALARMAGVAERQRAGSGQAQDRRQGSRARYLTFPPLGRRRVGVRPGISSSEMPKEPSSAIWWHALQFVSVRTLIFGLRSITSSTMRCISRKSGMSMKR